MDAGSIPAQPTKFKKDGSVMKCLTPKGRNFVHKNMAKFCKPKVFRDRKKDYSRKEKFKGKLAEW